MKMSILSKLLILLLLVSILPLALLGLMATDNVDRMGHIASSNIDKISFDAIEDSTEALNELGEEIITQKAVDVAKQLEIYIKENPDMTVEDLQNDEYFSELAVQPVGDTGYTAITDVETLTCRFHVNPNVANLELKNLAETLPGFWEVMSQSRGGIAVHGYYDWAEPDGSIEQKYMYIAIVDAETADGVVFSVAATTYIDEFSAPIVAIEEKISESSRAMNLALAEVAKNTRNQLVTFLVIILIIACIVGYLFAKSLSDPIKKLKEAADKVTSGEFDTELPKPSNDEVGELTGSLEMLLMAFKMKSKDKKKK